MFQIRSDDVFKVNSVESDKVVCDENVKKEIECKLGRLNNNAKVFILLLIHMTLLCLILCFICSLCMSTSVLSFLFQIHFNLSLIPSQDFISSLDTHASFFNITAKITTLSALSNPDTTVKYIKAPIDVQGSLQLSR